MIRRAETSDYAEMDAVFRASATALCIRDYDNKKVLDWVGVANPERFVISANHGCTQYVKILADKVVCFGELNIAK